MAGESGAGKSFLARSIIKLLPKNLATLEAGDAHFQSEQFGRIDLLKLEEKKLQKIRGKELTLLFQETNAALNPSLRIGKQIARTIKRHSDLSTSDCKIKALDLLKDLNFESPEKDALKFPHELSGGMAQRVNVANAMANEPSLIIADECTSSLDQENDSLIIDLLKSQVESKGLSVLFISHDEKILKKSANKIFVLEDGEIREQTPQSDEKPDQDVAFFSGWRPTEEGSEPWLEVRDLTMEFGSGGLFSSKKDRSPALRNIDLKVSEGRSLGIFGRSGAGKSTLGKLFLDLINPTSGEILIDGNQFGKDQKRSRKDYQIVFQELTLSMNPFKSICFHLLEPLKIHGIGSSSEQMELVRKVLSLLNLPEEILDRFPHQLSVGQRQRVLLGRCLVLSPKVIVLDEAVSSLDKKNKQEIISILKELKQNQGVRFILISHEIPAIEELCDQVIELEKGSLIKDLSKP